ncbi:MAG: DUF3313 domain-containing protein [Burkholderiales bacterium]
MIRSIAGKAALAVLGAALGAGLAGNAAAQGKESGFLKDYSQLKVEKDPTGVERRVWVSPKFTGANYQKILLDPIVFYPEPQASEQVSKDTLANIISYANRAMKEAVATTVPMDNGPGPGVARVRVAFTAAGVAGADFKPYQLVPVALVFTVAKKASGNEKGQATLQVESEITDSVTGETLALIVRSAKGIEVKAGQPLTMAEARPQINAWTNSVRQSLDARMRKK